MYKGNRLVVNQMPAKNKALSFVFTVLFSMMALLIVLLVIVFYFSEQAETIPIEEKKMGWIIVGSFALACLLLVVLIQKLRYKVHLSPDDISLKILGRTKRSLHKSQIAYISFVRSAFVLGIGHHFELLPFESALDKDFVEKQSIFNPSFLMILVSAIPYPEGQLPDMQFVRLSRDYIFFHRDIEAAQWIQTYYKDKIR